MNLKQLQGIMLQVRRDEFVGYEVGERHLIPYNHLPSYLYHSPLRIC